MSNTSQSFVAGFGKNGKIGITVPRRLAALTVAQRVAQELHCLLGKEVGYQIRFDDLTSQVSGKDGCTHYGVAYIAQSAHML